MDQIPVLWYYISSMLLTATHYSLTETVNIIEAKAQNWIQCPKGLDTEITYFVIQSSYKNKYMVLTDISEEKQGK